MKHAVSVRRTLRKAWELDDAAQAERLIRDLAKLMGACDCRLVLQNLPNGRFLLGAIG